MTDLVTIDDLPSTAQTHELIDAMLAGANAKAARVAPCLYSTDPAPSPAQTAEARLVLIGAIKRWAESETGAFQSQTVGPFAYTTDSRQRSGFNLWPSEIEALQSVCNSGGSVAAFAIDTAPAMGGVHLPWCSLNFGATYCSCGVDIAGYPIFEAG